MSGLIDNALAMLKRLKEPLPEQPEQRDESGNIIQESVPADSHAPADKILVGCSGGKDSMTVLDLVCRVFDRQNVFPFFLYFVRGLECEEKFVSGCEKRYGLKVIRLRHPDATAYAASGEFRPKKPSVDSRIQIVRWIEIEAVLRGRTGAKWIAYGHRISDSLQRRGMIMGSAGFLEKFQRIYPIWDWVPEDVISYLRIRKIPVPGMFGAKIHNTSGVSPNSTQCLEWLKQFYPKDYQKLVAVFPFAKSLLDRDKIRRDMDLEKPPEQR